MIANSVSISIFDKEYEIKYPNVGNTLAIENLKQLLTKNTYGLLSRSNHDSANELLDVVDAFSYFAVMVPELTSKFTLDFFTNIEPLEAAKLRKSYNEYSVFLQTTKIEITKLLNPVSEKSDV